MSPSGPGSDPRGLATVLALVVLSTALLLSATVSTAQAAGGHPGARVVELSGPVVLDGPVVYPAGTHVRVLPGTTLTASPAGAPAGITVEGPLVAVGTPDAPIRFTTPFTVRTVGAGATLIEHASFEIEPARGCSLALATQAATLRSVTIRGGFSGLCVGPPVEASTAVGDLPPGAGLPPPAGDSSVAGNTLAPPRASSLHSPPPAGLGLDLLPLQPLRLSTTAPEGVVVEGLNVSGTGVGVRVADGAPLVSISDSTIAGNDVGVLSEGGEVWLDHVTLEGNRYWDIQAQREGDIRWTGTHVEASCAKLAPSTAGACERGSISQTPLLWLLGIVFLATEAGRHALVRFAIWLRLYSRLSKEELLDHPARAQLVELVTENPGMHFRELEREVPGVGRTRRHLHRLEAAGLVTGRRDGRYLRFYPPGQARDGETNLPTRLRIQDVVEERPGIHVSRVADELDLSRQLVSWHVRRLHQAGRLKRRKDEQKVRLYPASPE